MCLKKQVTSSASDMQGKIKTPRSPYRRHLREPLKPRLPRNIVASARVNLNSYWSAFEELSKLPNTELSMKKTASALLNNTVYSTYHDNEINENLVNELIELGNNNLRN